MNRYLILLLLTLFFTNCKTVSVQQEAHYSTQQNIMLGVVGNAKEFILEQDYNHTAIPTYKTPIKVQVISSEFDNNTFKAFSEAKPYQNQDINIDDTDESTDKPIFLKLEIADRVALLNALQDEENADIFEFLKNKNDSHIVTSIAMVLNQKDITTVINADEVFLEASGIKSYALKIYNNKVLQQTIMFNQGIIFAYQTSYCCWKENDQRRLEIVDLVESNDKCPNKTSKSAKKAKKKIKYHKF